MNKNARHAGGHDDIKDDSGYQPQHARTGYGKGWQQFDESDADTTVIPAVDSKKKGK